MTKLIFDVGFNVGQDTAFYLSQGHRVVAVEADPTLAAAGRTRFAQEVASGQLEIVNVGIAESTGSADFWICEGKPEFNSFFKNIAARDGYKHHKITVPTAPLTTLLDRFGTPHFLKIDIEGHDMLCLVALESRPLPAYLSVESECPIEHQPASIEDGLRVLHQLHRLGYTRFKLIQQLDFNSYAVPPSIDYLMLKLADDCLLRPPLRHIPGMWRLTQQLKPKPRLERRFGREFPLGCSGAWGEDTAGRWLGVEEAEKAYRHYREQHFSRPDVRHYSFWCDWHARADGRV